jgi:hypothetical protein
MNPSNRETHRAAIKQRMYRNVDRRWEALYGLFGGSIVCTGLGIKFCLMSQYEANIIGSVAIGLGLLAFAGHSWLLRMLRKQGNALELLKPIDQIVIAAILVAAILLSNLNSDIWIVALLLANVYGAWRLKKNSQPYWYRFYFRAGRVYLREIKGSGSKSMNQPLRKP